MFVAGLRAIAILKDRTSWSVIWRSLCLTIVVLITLYALVWWGLFQISLFETVWIDRIIDVLGGLAVLLLTWMLFPAVVTLVMTIFLERILRWVEARHYPDLPAPRSQPLMEVLAISAKLTGMTVILQLLIVPLYFFPAVGVPLSFLVNAILLGREYFELVAIRRMDGRDLRQLRGRFRLRTLLAGCFIALWFAVPFLNLLAPIVSSAFMLHVFQGLPGQAPVLSMSREDA